MPGARPRTAGLGALVCRQPGRRREAPYVARFQPVSLIRRLRGRVTRACGSPQTRPGAGHDLPGDEMLGAELLNDLDRLLRSRERGDRDVYELGHLTRQSGEVAA
jgi:hypothetical protein